MKMCLQYIPVYLWLFISDIPYSFEYQVTILPLEEDEVMSQARAIADKYSQYSHRVELLGMYRASSGLTCLGKVCTH